MFIQLDLNLDVTVWFDGFVTCSQAVKTTAMSVYELRRQSYSRIETGRQLKMRWLINILSFMKVSTQMKAWLLRKHQNSNHILLFYWLVLTFRIGLHFFLKVFGGFD